MTDDPSATVTFECSTPILRVENMEASLCFYVDVLGFQAAEWSDDDFTCVSREKAGIYLCQRGQGCGGAWAWIGVSDVERLHERYKALGAKVILPPTNYPWALEMQVEDHDGNVLRFGSDPK
jgi:predicted enzyme related to lactoylglutathione lyase